MKKVCSYWQIYEVYGQNATTEGMVRKLVTELKI